MILHITYFISINCVATSTSYKKTGTYESYLCWHDTSFVQFSTHCRPYLYLNLYGQSLYLYFNTVVSYIILKMYLNSLLMIQRTKILIQRTKIFKKNKVSCRLQEVLVFCRFRILGFTQCKLYELSFSGQFSNAGSAILP